MAVVHVCDIGWSGKRNDRRWRGGRTSVVAAKYRLYDRSATRSSRTEVGTCTTSARPKPIHVGGRGVAQRACRCRVLDDARAKRRPVLIGRAESQGGRVIH